MLWILNALDEHDQEYITFNILPVAYSHKYSLIELHNSIMVATCLPYSHLVIFFFLWLINK